MNNTIKKTNDSLKLLIQRAEILNSLLPSDESLEPLITILLKNDKDRTIQRERSRSNAKDYLPKPEQMDVIEANIIKSASNIEDILGNWIKSKEHFKSPVSKN